MPFLPATFALSCPPALLQHLLSPAPAAPSARAQRTAHPSSHPLRTTALLRSTLHPRTAHRAPPGQQAALCTGQPPSAGPALSSGSLARWLTGSLGSLAHWSTGPVEHYSRRRRRQSVLTPPFSLFTLLPLGTDARWLHPLPLPIPLPWGDACRRHRALTAGIRQAAHLRSSFLLARAAPRPSTGNARCSAATSLSWPSRPQLSLQTARCAAAACEIRVRGSSPARNPIMLSRRLNLSTASSPARPPCRT